MAHPPSLKKKKAAADQKSGSTKEFRAIRVGISLSVPELSFLQSGSQSGLSPLGKIAAKAWLQLGERGRLRVDAMVFRDRELEGLLFVPVGTDSETKLGLAMRWFKASISKAAAAETAISAVSTVFGLWKRAYLSQSLATPQEIAGVRKRLRLESETLRRKA